jgi:acyl-CoA synthetase (AMP-forming)/AMP-acid ligase II
MLYERWERIAAERGRAVAFSEMGGKMPWTFEMLAQKTRELKFPSRAINFPQLSHDQPKPGLATFLMVTLHAWRFGNAICPLEPGQPRPELEDIPPGTALLKTTSATTGAARYVAFTEAQLAADADNIVATMGLRRDWTNLGVIPVAHSYGFSNLILPLLLHGIPLLRARSPLPEEVRQAAARAPDLTLPAVPAMWRAWHEAGAIPPNVRLAISAGAPLPLPLEREVFEQTGLKIHNFYGATECGGIAYDAGKKPRTDPACVGAPMKNVRLSTNKEGGLVVRSKAVGRSYWPDAAANLSRARYVTSDLGEIRGNRVYLRGRAGDVINVAGRKVSPEVIERALLTHSAVRECLVLGAPAPDASRGERIVACVVATPGTTAQVLKEHLLNELPAWQIPRDWHFLETLSPNQRGKLSRAEWRARLAAGGSGTTSGTSMRQGLVLDKVVLLGRTLDEYTRYFALDLEKLRGQRVLDVASGVSSFRAEAGAHGLDVTAFDLIYDWPSEEIARRCGPDLDQVLRDISGLKTYKWDFYRDTHNLRRLREKSYRAFLADFALYRGSRYIAGRLPKLPFGDQEFDLTLVSYLLLVYEDHFDYEFHRQSLLDLMRVTRGEARLYPLVTFEARRSTYIDRFKTDAALRQFRFEEVRTDFEFLVGSNWFLRVTHA